MALQPQTLSFLFLALFLLSHHSQARDSQFFSKVPHVNKEETATTTTTVVNPNNKNNKQEQEPNFIPDTQNNGYGLYGHEYGQLPPSETTTNTNEEQHYTTTATTKKTYEPYTTPTSTYEKESHDNTPTTYEPYTTPIGPNYGAEPEEVQEPKNKYKFNNAQLYDNNNNENYNNQNNAVRANNNNNNNKNNYYNNNNVERQGMSDTRFMAGGKYYFDVNSERNNYNPNSYDEKNYDPNTYSNDRVVDYSRNNNNNDNNNYKFYGNNLNQNSYGTNRYNNNNYKFYGNNLNENSYETNRYNNNNNNYNNNNSFEGYQNEQFQENDDEFVP